jgi:23S rRNA pseudouridine1911/1915/1917 synthase
MKRLPSDLEILFEDDQLLAVVKPMGIPTANAPAGAVSLYSLARQARPFIGVVSRIDAPVSGVVVFAKTSAAAAGLSEQFRLRAVAKDYVAIVEGRFPAPLGAWIDWEDTMPVDNGAYGRSARAPRKAAGGHRESPPADDRADSDGEEGGRDARTRARVVRRAGEVSLVELEPATGRKHQLRIQLSLRRCPIVGDRRYGARLPFPGGIALHARSLAVAHPKSGKRLQWEAPLPPDWARRFPPLFAGG